MTTPPDDGDREAVAEAVADCRNMTPGSAVRTDAYMIPSRHDRMIADAILADLKRRGRLRDDVVWSIGAGSGGIVAHPPAPAADGVTDDMGLAAIRVFYYGETRPQWALSRMKSAITAALAARKTP